MKLTRRSLAGAVLGSAPVLNAARASAQPPQPAPPPSPDDDLKAARQQVRKNADALASFKIPMATEPACIFKA